MKKNHLAVVAILGLAVLFAGYITWNSYQGNKGAAGADLTSFVQCLKDKGVTFYGAWWCPHCADQEKELGMSRQQLASAGLYTECSTPNGQSQEQTCINKGITEYPTWVFPDGSVLKGVQSLQTLSEKSQCPLPASAQPGAPTMTPTMTSAASAATSTAH